MRYFPCAAVEVEENQMGSSMIQLIILAGIALFLILRLRSVLGTRDGFEKKIQPETKAIDARTGNRGMEVIEGGLIDHDIADFIDEKSETGHALTAMKVIEPSFSVTAFMQGAKQAYEMLVMAFQHGDTDTLKKFLSPEVFESFAKIIDTRIRNDWKVEASFGGIREVTLTGAELDKASNEADITIRFVGEFTSVTRDAAKNIVEGDANAIRKQKDVWTFSRVMGSNNPNWVLVATGA